jgi:hypothetical protein
MSIHAHLASRANTVEPALPGHWCCPLEGEAAEGRFGGEQ